MKLRYLLILCLAISITNLSAQAQFHRTYELVAGDSIQTTDASLSGGGSYYNVGAFIEDDVVTALQVNGFNGKGDVNWSKLLYSADSIPFSGLASIHYHLDTIFVAASISAPNTNKILFALDGRGNPIKTTYYKNEDLDNQGPIQISAFLDQDLLWSTSTILNGNTRASVSRLKTNGEVVWNRTFENVRNNVNVLTINQNSKFFQDSTLSLIGRTQEAVGNNFSAYISRLNIQGSEIWSKEYALNSTNQHQVVFYTTAYVNDSTTVAIGNISDSNIESGIITLVDSIGDEIWTKDVSFGNGITQLYDVNVTETGLIHVYGESVDNVLNTTTSFLLELGIDGNQLQLIEYTVDVIAPAGKSATLLPTPSDGGYAIFGPASDSVTLVNNFIKVDALLMTPCSVIRMDTIVSDINLIVSPIEWVADNAFDPIDSISTVVNYNGITVPTLSLTDTTYCPQDPIMKVYDAFQEEATAYIWNTGDTTSSIIATEEGMFMVTVTMGEGICWSICDTVMIDRYPLPGISINQNNTNYCSSGNIELSMIYQQGAPFRNENIVWSTNETGLSINVDALGTYSVIVTDDCGNTGEASVIISEFPDVTGTVNLVKEGECGNQITANYMGFGSSQNYKWDNGDTTNSIFVSTSDTYTVTVTNECDIEIIESITVTIPNLEGIITITQDITDICINSEVNLVANYSGSGMDNLKYEWSTGESVDSIFVATEGLYSVTVTNACGVETKDSIPVSFPNLNGVLIIESEQIDSCENRAFILNPRYAGQIAETYSWSTGESTESITISDAGTYTLTITNTCGVEDIKSIEIGPQTGGIDWPKVFFPNPRTIEPENKTFGPIVACPDLIENYELHIFNRWGNEVFESTEVTDRWDGNHNDDPSVGAIYVYWAKYTVDGVETVKKGDVNLIR